MVVILLRLSGFNSILDGRPSNCPHCGSELFQGWGSGTKPVQDSQMEIGEYHRYRCNNCFRTFRTYPPGIDRTSLSQRIRRMAGMAWVLGLSSRNVADLFSTSGVDLHYMAVWREGKDLLARLIDRFGAQQSVRYSIDKEFLKIKTRGIGTSILVDLGGGKTVLLGRIAEVDYRKILEWLQPIISGLDIHVSLIGTDFLFETNVM